MIWFIAFAVLIIGACAAGSWWWVSSRLSNAEATAVYDIEEAADRFHVVAQRQRGLAEGVVGHQQGARDVVQQADAHQGESIADAPKQL